MCSLMEEDSRRPERAYAWADYSHTCLQRWPVCEKNQVFAEGTKQPNTPQFPPPALPSAGPPPPPPELTVLLQCDETMGIPTI